MHAGRYLPNTKSKHPPPVAITPTTLPPLLRQASIPVNSHSSSLLLPPLPPAASVSLLSAPRDPLSVVLTPLTAAVGAWTFTDVITPTNVYKRTVMTHVISVPRTWIFATSRTFSYAPPLLPRHRDEFKTTKILELAKLTLVAKLIIKF